MATPPKIPGLGAFVDKNAGTPRPPAPRSVAAAAWLMVLGACAQLVASVIAVAYAASPERLDKIQASLDTMTGTVPSLEAARNTGIITVVFAGIGTICAYLLFAWFLRKGKSWARAAVGVLVALTCVQLVGISYPLGITTVVQLVLGVLAFALSYLPASNRYFAAIKSGR